MAKRTANWRIVPPAPRLVATADDGTYLGSVSFDAINAEALQLLSQMFQEFVAQQTRGIQVAGAGALSGLKS